MNRSSFGPSGGRNEDAAPSLAARDFAAFWHPCGQMRDYLDFPPLEIVGARGARLRLADGREILDAISSWWCKSLGHGHAGVRARIARQLDRFEHVIAANTTHADLVELCERLLAMANGAAASVWGPRTGTGGNSKAAGGGRHFFGKVFFAENGSTAVEIALKMALQAQAQRGRPERTRFAALSGGYHGETAGALSVGDLGLYSDPFAAMTFPVHKLEPLPYRSGPRDPAWQDAAVEWRAIEAQLFPLRDQLAAIVYEPVLQAAGGMRLYSPALLPRLRRFAHAHDILLVADEIASGMGRLGTMLAGDLCAEPEDWRPDFLLLGKGLTAGFLPLAAVLTTDDVFATFFADAPSADVLAGQLPRHRDEGHRPGRPFLHSNTHTANALTVAAALGALDAYATEGILEHVAIEGERMGNRLRELAATRATLVNPRALGMVAAVDLRARDGGALDPAARSGYRVYRAAVSRGALLRPLGDTLYLFPPLNCERGDLDALSTILADSVDEVLGKAP